MVKRQQPRRIPQVTLESLPPEIILAIAREVAHSPTPNRGIGPGPFGLGGIDDEDPLGPMVNGPEDLMRMVQAAFLAGGPLGMGMPAGGGIPPPAPAQAPPPPPPQAIPQQNPNVFAFNFQLPPFNAPAPPPTENQRPLAAPAPNPNSDDEMPALEEISDDDEPAEPRDVPAPQAPPAAPPVGGMRPAAPAVPYDVDSSDDEMPALSPVAPVATPATADARASPVEDDDPPELAIRPAPTPVAADRNADSSGDEETGAALPANSPVTLRASSSNGESEDDMPALEEISDDDGTPARVIAARADPQQSVPGNDESNESNDQSDWEDDESEGADDSDSDSDSDNDSDGGNNLGFDASKLFPLGLPRSPMIPLALVSRPFLHAARKILYRNVILETPWQASLFLRSLSSPKHAASHILEAREGNPPNALAEIVRKLKLLPSPEMSQDISMGRGGGSVYMDILAACEQLEDLSVSVTFKVDASQAYLSALRNMNRLKAVSLSGAYETDKGFMLTTARIYNLMNTAWPDLELLQVVNMQAAEDGPYHEEKKMWKDLDEQEDSGEVAVESTRRGLTHFELNHPDVSYVEMAALLRHSRKTLESFVLVHASPTLSRYGLTHIVLNFCTNLTSIRLSVSKDWHPRTSTGKPPYPISEKGLKAGYPDDALITSITRYPFLLDAILPHMRQLVTLSWDGLLASTSMFMHCPPRLAHVTWGHCTAIQPKPLARVLVKYVNIQSDVTGPDGTTLKKVKKVRVGPALCCFTVNSDDYNWTDEEVAILRDATISRGMSLSLSGTVAAAAMFGP